MTVTCVTVASWYSKTPHIRYLLNAQYQSSDVDNETSILKL